MSDETVQAKMYDEMINWETRLAREIPVISKFFNPGSVLDIACSSGRHSFALEKLGFETVGIDISESMIELALELKTQLNSKAIFHCVDGTSPEFINLLIGKFYDNALLLGNAIANLGTFENGRQLIRNLFILVRPAGKLFVQTVFRPSKPFYNPLRTQDDKIIQRIMVPVTDEKHNVELHVNIIDPHAIEYHSQKSDNEFYMYTLDEFKNMVTMAGWVVSGVYRGYERGVPQQEDGETLIWELIKPEMSILPETRHLFKQYGNIEQEDIIARVSGIWQNLAREHWYRCLVEYRFLFPRITVHPRYREVLEEHIDGKFLDIACFTGTDLRQLVVEGMDPTNLTGIDISATYIDAGYVIFGDKVSSKLNFHVCDVTTDKFLRFDGSIAVGGDFLDFGDFFDGIHAGSLLHLLSDTQIELLVEKIYFLLKPGGVFFGRTVGKSMPIDIKNGLRSLHSPDSLSTLFHKYSFKEVQVVKYTDSAEDPNSKELFHLMYYGKKPL